MAKSLRSLRLDPSTTSRCMLVDPVTREPISDEDGGLFIEVRSPWSQEADKHRFEVQDRARKLGRELNAKEQRDNYDAYLAKLTVGWNLPDDDGAPKPCNFASAREVYSDAGLYWIKEQVSEFINDRGNFRNPGSTTSEPGPDTSLTSA